jgi:hypothetical protein
MAEMMTPDRQGMMGPDVSNEPAPTGMEMESQEGATTQFIRKEIRANIKNLTPEELNIATQLNVEPFRNFMSKIFGPEFGMLMEQELPKQEQPVSPQSESPAPTTGGGMMTQPPVTA